MSDKLMKGLQDDSAARQRFVISAHATESGGEVQRETPHGAATFVSIYYSNRLENVSIPAFSMRLKDR
jgi:hypothetical protein